MCTSDTEKKTALWYLLAAIFLALFGAVYEYFSFGVWSYFMVYAFVPPLLLGALPLIWLMAVGKHLSLPAPARWLWRTGVAALALGCVISGVLEIYGTASTLTKVYFLAGAFCLAACTTWGRVCTGAKSTGRGQI